MGKVHKVALRSIKYLDSTKGRQKTKKKHRGNEITTKNKGHREKGTQGVKKKKEYR